MKLIMLRGLPASGKSSWAKQFIAKQSNSDWARINKDDLRSMCHDGKWSKKREDAILEYRNQLIIASLLRGVNVIVDDTNFHPKHEHHLRDIAIRYGADFEIKDFHADVRTCIKRDLGRPVSVGKDVIWNMWKQFVLPTLDWPKDRLQKTPAILCDLDGTLANIDHRNPYDASSCEDDGLNTDVLIAATNQLVPSAELVLVSGRSDKYRPETERWLAKNGVHYDALFMRQKCDTRKDWLVKFEILRDLIAPRWNPYAVFDDRDQVVAMWRKQGLRCFQVADGNF